MNSLQDETVAPSLTRDPVEGLLLLNRKREITYTSALILKLLGYPLDALKGQDFLGLFREDEKNIVDRALQTQQTNTASAGLICHIRSYNGNYSPFHLRLDPFQHTASGLVVYIKYLPDRGGVSTAVHQLKGTEVLPAAQPVTDFGYWQLDLISEDLKSNTLYWSDEVYGIFETTKEEVTPTPDIFYSFVHPDDRLVLEQTFGLAVQRREVFNTVHRIITAKGKTKWVHQYCGVFADAADNPLKVIGTVQDITDRKLAEEKLRHSYIELQDALTIQTSILDALPAHIALLNGDGTIIAVNKAWRTFAAANSYVHEQLGVGENYLTVCDSANGNERQEAQQTAAGIREVISGTAEQFCMEYSCDSAQERRWFRMIVSPLNIRQSGAVVMHLNITEEKLARDLLLKSEANMRAIFNNTNTGFTLLDPHYHIVAFNPTAAEMVWQVQQKPLVEGVNFLNYYDTEAEQQRAAIVLNRVLEGDTIVAEVTRTGSDGKIRWYIVRMSRIAAGDVATGICVASMDITEKKLDELEKEKLTSDLLQRNQHLQQFTYIISHNLRGPVANIIAFSEELKDESYSDEHKQLFIRELGNAVSKLDGVITDLNQILQVNKEVAHARETVDLQQLVENIRNSISNVVEEKQAVFETNFDQVASISTIRSYLHSIFYNLISNSLKYQQPGIAPVIRINASRSADEVTILFKDNGSGIDLTKKGDQVFGLYKRFHSNIEGKGMGLFMTRAQVEALGGQIEIRSKPNKGTSFIIRFRNQPK